MTGFEERPPTAPRAPRDGAVRLLLVEDDAELAELYIMRFELDGYQVLWAHDGEEGLEAVRTWQPDLTLLDMRMPGMAGIDVLRTLREDPATAGCAVVVLSNYGDPELRDEARRLGALDWVIKSNTTPREMLERAAEWVAIERAEEAGGAPTPGLHVLDEPAE